MFLLLLLFPFAFPTVLLKTWISFSFFFPLHEVILFVLFDFDFGLYFLRFISFILLELLWLALASFFLPLPHPLPFSTQSLPSVFSFFFTFLRIVDFTLIARCQTSSVSHAACCQCCLLFVCLRFFVFTSAFFFLFFFGVDSVCKKAVCVSGDSLGLITCCQ